MARRRQYASQQTQYLRISKASVIQMSLYLDPLHVDWMSDDVLERVLAALRDRIPIKLRKEADQGKTKKKGKSSSSMDIYRGVNFQVGYFFRPISQKHAVLLKDKTLIFPSRPPSPTPARLSPSPTHSEHDIDLTSEPDEVELALDALMNSRSIPRSDTNADVVVKEEELDDVAMPSQPPLFDPEALDEDKDDVKMFEEGTKPVLKVSYHGYSIFGRMLIVIVEPFPALHPSQYALPRPSATPEIRQLSASAAPESLAYPSGRRSMSQSSTPAPLFRSSNPLFRAESVTTDQDGEEADDDHEVGDEDEDDADARRLRKSGMALFDGSRGRRRETDLEEDD